MFKSFFTSECGAVTADWVVLTAGVITMAMVVAFSVSVPTNGHAIKIGDSLHSMSPRN